MREREARGRGPAGAGARRGPGAAQCPAGGICGSDLHARHHADEQADVLAEAGYDGFMRSDQRVVFGHEFSGEVADYGPRSRRKVATGTPVVALPLSRRGEEMHAIGLSHATPGAYAEQVVVEEALMLPLPNGLPPELGGADRADGDRLARGPPSRDQEARRGDRDRLRAGRPRRDLHAQGPRGSHGRGERLLGRPPRAGQGVRRGRRGRSARAALPTQAPGSTGHLKTVPGRAELGLDDDAEAQAPAGARGSHVWRAADALGVKPKRPVIFECVGVPGIIDGIIASAPLFSRVVVVGVCMEPDRIRPAMAINKEIDLRFVVGYTPLEFRDTLHMLAEGKVTPHRSSPGPSACRASRAPSTRSATPRPTPRSSSTPRARPPRPPSGPDWCRDGERVRDRRRSIASWASTGRIVSTDPGPTRPPRGTRGRSLPVSAWLAGGGVG